MVWHIPGFSGVRVHLANGDWLATRSPGLTTGEVALPAAESTIDGNRGFGRDVFRLASGTVMAQVIAVALMPFAAFDENRAHEHGEHWGEIGSSRETRRPEILRILRKHYDHVCKKRYALNPYHQAFVASDRNSAYLSGGSRGRSLSKDQDHAQVERERTP